MYFTNCSARSMLSSKLKKNTNLNGQAFNFGPKNLNHINTKTLVNKLNKYSESIISENFSYVIKGNKSSNFKESNLLQLNSQKARKLLNWKCILDIDQTLRYTAEWYLMFHEKKNILNFTLSQIEEYLNDFNSNYK